MALKYKEGFYIKTITSPVVILKSKFIQSIGKEFSSYIDYIDRETAEKAQKKLSYVAECYPF